MQGRLAELVGPVRSVQTSDQGCEAILSKFTSGASASTLGHVYHSASNNWPTILQHN